MTSNSIGRSNAISNAASASTSQSKVLSEVNDGKRQRQVEGPLSILTTRPSKAPGPPRPADNGLLRQAIASPRGMIGGPFSPATGQTEQGLQNPQIDLNSGSSGLLDCPTFVASASKKSLEQLGSPLQSVIASEALSEAVQRGEASEWMPFNGGYIKARHEPEYNLIRVYVGPSQEVVNINLSEDKKTVCSIVGHPKISDEKLSDLTEAGIFRSEVMPMLGISLDEIKELSERSAVKQQPLALRFQT